MEEWRAICSHYDVSNHGRVKRTAPGQGAKAGLILKPRVNIRGYVNYELHRRTHQGHQLVLCGFIGPRPSGLEVNHKDGDPLNNHLDNLEYVSRSENIRHAFKNGLIKIRIRCDNCGRFMKKTFWKEGEPFKDVTYECFHCGVGKFMAVVG